MLFNTVSYLSFVVVAATAFWLLARSARLWLLLAASLLFYALWRVEFVALITFSAAIDFYCSLKIGAEPRPGRRRGWLILALATNLILLGYFKYTYFVLDNAAAVGSLLGQDWHFRAGAIILPLGISFYTFLSISYTLDVYRGVFRPIRSFPLYLTYVMFWPHMIAGPILRAHELVPQLTDHRPLDIDSLAAGARAILFGLFLKVALADQLAPMVDDAFLADPRTVSALDVWTMAFAFGLQIYFDFAGYSLIAIGSARLLGIRFPQNFDWPYLATSPREFWKRWHITLSSWVRDYLYLPLAGRSARGRSEGGLDVAVLDPGSVGLTAALFLTWFLMGLWHGANWNFALWGLWHATFIWLYRVAAPRLPSRPASVAALGGWAITLGIIMLGWIPFRAQSVESTLVLLGRLSDWRGYTYLSFRDTIYQAVAALFIGMLLLHLTARWLEQRALPKQIADVIAVAATAFVVFIFLRPTSQFIYFQF